MSIGQKNIDVLKKFKPDDYEEKSDNIYTKSKSLKMPVINSKSVIESKNILKSKVIEEKHITYEIHENTRSIKDKQLLFTNYLRNKSCEEADKISKIYGIHKKTYKASEFCVELDGEEPLEMNYRMEKILKSSDVFQKNRTLVKANFSNIVTKGVYGSSKQQPTRIIIDDTEKYFKRIILVDLYHLFASNYELEKNFKFYSSYNYCMKNLFGKC